MENPAGTEPGALTWDAVVEAAQLFQGGEHAALAAVFRGRSEAERKALLPDVQHELRLRSGSYEQYHSEARLRYTDALPVVGAACLSGPAAVAAWLDRRDLHVTHHHVTDAIVDVLTGRGVSWLPDLVVRIADGFDGTEGQAHWRILPKLADRCGVEVPLTDGFVLGWVVEQGRVFRRDRPELLDTDPFLDVILPRVFEVPDVGLRMLDRLWGLSWPDHIAGMCARGRLDRTRVLDLCVSRLVRGAPTAERIRVFVEIHDALAPTDDELARHAVAFVRLLADGIQRVAGWAQAHLRRLDEAGLLTEERRTEAAVAGLARGERKLVRDQLVWIDKFAPAQPGLVALVPAALSHEAADIQERALKLIAKHLPRPADQDADAVRTAVAESIPHLAVTVRPRATELAGAAAESTATATGEGDATEDGAAPRIATGPAALPPRVLRTAITSLDELVEELAGFLGRAGFGRSTRPGPIDPWDLERLVAGLLDAAVRDRTALSSAVDPLARRFGAPPRRYMGPVAGALLAMTIACSPADVEAREVPPDWPVKDFSFRVGEGTNAPTRAILARLYETAWRLGDPRGPGPYLARPAVAPGYVDPDALVRGLAEWEALGRDPWPRDLEQALLRIAGPADGEVLERARRLKSPAGELAARALEVGGMPAPEVFLADRSWTTWKSDAYVVSNCPMPGVGPVPDLFAGRELAAAVCELGPHVWDGLPYAPSTDVACWPLLAPAHRDVIAAHTAFAHLSNRDEENLVSGVLPLLAEADGPLGLGMETALALGCAAATSSARLHTAEAFVTLAARADPDWDLPALGARMAYLVGAGVLLPNRLVDTLGHVVRAEAHAAVWQLMTGLLPGLLDAQKRAPRLADLLAMAAECAALVGARGAVGGLGPQALKGGSRVAVEGRRLLAVLDGRV